MPAALGSSSDSAQGPSSLREKEVAGASLLRRDERYESREVGGKLAPRSGALSIGSWMKTQEEEGGIPTGKKKIVSSCLPSSPLRYFRSVPDAERASLRTKELSADKHRVGLPCVSCQSP